MFGASTAKIVDDRPDNRAAGGGRQRVLRVAERRHIARGFHFLTANGKGGEVHIIGRGVLHGERATLTRPR